MKPIVPISLCLVLVACSSEPSEPSDRPGSAPGQSGGPGQAADAVLAEALADGRQRVVTPDVTFFYDNCGTIFGRSEAGSLYCVDIADGSRVDFNPKSESLSINGEIISVKSVELAKKTDSTSWWVIELAESSDERVIFVTNF